MLDLKCFWFTRVVPFGRTKIQVLGAYPKANRKRAKNCSRPRGVNFARKLGLNRRETLRISEPYHKRADKQSTLGRSRWIQPRLSPKSAIRSNWSGLHAREKCRLFRRLIVRSSSPLRPRRQR